MSVRLVSAAELAAFFSVRQGTVLEWVRQERIPFLRVSRRILRFDIDAVRQAVESRRPTTERTTP
jgi:excisionase family DNA binding protein